MHEDDQSLVDRLIAGESSAWDQFVHRYERLVHARIAQTAREYGIRPQQGDVEEIASEVFAQLVRRQFAALKAFQGRSRLSTWLYVIVRRTALKSLARRVKHDAVGGGQSADQLDAVADSHAGDPVARLMKQEQRNRVLAGLAQLGEPQQSLVRMFYLEDKSYREISKQLQMPMGSIGPTLKRAQKKLKEILEPEEG